MNTGDQVTVKMKIKVKLQRPGYPCLDKKVVYVTIEDPEITRLENKGYYITEVTLV